MHPAPTFLLWPTLWSENSCQALTKQAEQWKAPWLYQLDGEALLTVPGVFAW